MIDNLIAFAKDVEDKATALAEWRKSAGLKSNWTAHTNINEASLYADLEALAETLTQWLHQHLPARWNLTDWSVKANRMGDGLAWAAKHGKGRVRISLNPNAADILTFMIHMKIIGEAAQNTSTCAEQKTLGIEKGVFTFVKHNTLVHQSGDNAMDAYLKAMATGVLDVSRYQSRDSSLDKIEQDASLAFKRYLKQPFSWSLYETLMDKLFQQPVMKKQKVTPHCLKNMTKERIRESSLDVDGVNSLLHALLGLAEAGNSFVKNPYTHYLVIGGSPMGEGVKARSAPEALLIYVLRRMQENILLSLENMSVFEVKQTENTHTTQIVENRLSQLQNA